MPNSHLIIWKHWRAHMRTNTIMILVLVLGMGIYLFYSSWTRTVATSEAVVRPDLNGEVVVVMPHWTTYMMAPGFLNFQAEVVEGLAGAGWIDTVPGYHFPVHVKWGRETVIGLPTEFPKKEPWDGLDVVAGRHPEAPGEVIVEGSRPITVGESLDLTYWHPFQEQSQGLIVTVVGRYQTGDPTRRGIVISESDAQALSGLPSYNYGQIWLADHPHSRRYSFDNLLGNLMDILKPTRVPSMSLGEAKVNLPFAFLVEPLVFHEGTPIAVVNQMVHSQVTAVSIAVGAVFLLMVLAIAVLVIIQIVETQRSSGVYLVLGFEPRDVGRLYRLQISANIAIALPLGLLGAMAIHLVAGLPFSVRPLLGALTIWILFGLGLAAWTGLVSSRLVKNSDVSNQLRRASRFDWWLLIRLAE